jgi:hypothetical protein
MIDIATTATSPRQPRARRRATRRARVRAGGRWTLGGRRP